MSFLKLSGVYKNTGDHSILTDITFDQHKLEKIAVAGETGSGKSTLLKIVAGLDQADSGEVFFEEKRVEGAREKLVPGHPRIAYLSQHFELPKFLRVEQILSYSDTFEEGRSGRLYEICQIDHLMERKTDQLSGGERQRIALARTLISSPALLLLDEPFSNLDVIHKNTLKEIIDDLSAELEITVMLVSHDSDDSLPWADSVIVMRDGKIVQKGSPRDVYENPVNNYSAGLFGKYSLIDDEVCAKLGLPENTTIVRPEKLSLSSERNEGIQVTLKSIRFFGSYYEAEVEASDKTYFVFLEQAMFAPRQQLFLTAKYFTK